MYVPNSYFPLKSRYHPVFSLTLRIDTYLDFGLSYLKLLSKFLRPVIDLNSSGHQIKTNGKLFMFYIQGVSHVQ